MNSGIWSDSYSLEEVQERDAIKNNFCQQFNIPLIRIPYHKLKTLIIEDLLGDKYLYREK